MRCWCGYLRGARCRLFAYGPADATARHPKTPSSLASVNSIRVLPFQYWLTQVVLEKRPLNGCSSSSYETIPHVQLEISGDVLSTADMVVAALVGYVKLMMMMMSSSSSSCHV